MERLTYYTDGAIHGNGTDNPRGGWAFIQVRDGVAVDQGRNQALCQKPGTTNNTMELGGIYGALRHAHRISFPNPLPEVEIFTDSMLCIGWLAKGWSRKVEAIDKCVLAINHLISLFPRVTFHHVRGHQGNEFNEMADKLAVEGSDLPPNKPVGERTAPAPTP
jgi:ribonuclease HI